jgi:AraC-like DNA-binding protein
MDKDLFSIALTVPELINIVTALNLCILFIVLYFRKENTLPNRLLAFILLLPALSFVNNYLILSKTIYLFPSIVFISQIGALVGAPLIYLYTRIFMGGKWNPYFILNILTVIAILTCLHFFIIFLGYDTHAKNQFVNNLIHEIYPDYLTYIRGAFFILLNGYFLFIAVQVILYSRKIMNTQSELEKLKLRYLQQFIILLWALNITILVLYLFVANYYVDFVGVPIVTTVFYIFLVRTAFNHTAVFTRKDFSSFKNSLSKIENLNVSRFGAKEFSHEEIERIKEKIDYLMNEEKIYIDPDLSIIKLSEALGLTIHLTSYFINKYLNSNFFNLINSCRVELAKDKMRQRADKSEIEVIGYEVGFNSKSAFYRAFNKYVQLSPSEFIRKL